VLSFGTSLNPMLSECAGSGHAFEARNAAESASVGKIAPQSATLGFQHDRNRQPCMRDQRGVTIVELRDCAGADVMLRGMLDLAYTCTPQK